MWLIIHSSLIYWMMDINRYVGGRERRLTNQRQCWPMTSLCQPMRAVDRSIECCHPSIECLVTTARFCEVRLQGSLNNSPGSSTKLVQWRRRMKSCSNVKLSVNQTNDTFLTTFEDHTVVQWLSSMWRIISGWQTVGLGRSTTTTRSSQSSCGSTTWSNPLWDKPEC